MNDNTRKIIGNLRNFLLWSFITACCILGMVMITSLDMQRWGCIPESSLTEYLQEGLLASSALIFLWQSKKQQNKGLLLLSGLLFCMLIREWDSVFDLLFHGAWKFFALPLAGFFVYMALKDGKIRAESDLLEYMGSKSYGVLFIGLIILLVVSRIIGMRAIVKIMSSKFFSESLKNLMEEGMELVGYFYIFLSSLIYIWEQSQKKR